MGNRRTFLFTLVILLGCSSLKSEGNDVVLIENAAEYTRYNISKDDFVWYCKDNCYWCDRQDPVIEQLAQDFPQVRFFKVKSLDLAARKSVRSYPTSFFKTEKWVGFTDIGTLKRNITGLLER